MEPRFVGRAAELDELLARLDEALAGRPSVVLVAGEPGIGKTRLVAEACRIAGSRAVPVRWGTCTDDEGAPAYWPWRQILRAWHAGADPTAAAQHTAAAPELARIAPELYPGGPAGSGGPEDRFAAFDAAARFFTRVASPGGLVLVIDDAQWADPASLALLTHLARHVRDARLLVAVTSRVGAIGELARLSSANRIDLHGLDESAVAAALADRTGRQLPAEVVANVADRTRGNPFFVAELARALADPQAGAAVPDAVRDVVDHRLARLPATTRDLLDVAAVLGREFSAPVLATAVGEPADALLAALDPALDDGVLDRPAGRVVLRFAHDLVREAVLAALPAARRAQIHHRAAEGLAPRADDPDVTPDLARHALAALPLGDAAAAVAWTRAAAAQAMAQLAHEDAAQLLDAAVAVARPVLPVAERVELLLDAALAHAATGGLPAVTALSTEAADLARHAGVPELLGRAALVLPAVSDLEWLAMSRRWCEEALRLLDRTDTPLRSQLLAQLAHAMVYDLDHEGMAAASAEALAIAERLGDPAALVSALRARQLARSGGEGNAERRLLGDRMLALGARTGDTDTELWGHLWRFDSLLQAGATVDAELELDRLEPVVARSGRPMARFHLLRSRSALAKGRGRFAEALLLLDEASRIAVDGAQEGARLTALASRFEVMALTGNTEEPIATLVPVAGFDTPYAALIRVALALTYVAADRPQDAKRWFTALPEPGSRRLTPFTVLPIECQRAVLAADLGDAAAGEAAYRILLPQAELHLASGAGAASTGGSVHLYLGCGAIAAGRLDAAVRHLRAAVTANEQAGLAPYTAMARFRLAGALRARGRTADVDETTALLIESRAAAERMGLAPLLRSIERLATALHDGGVLSRRESEIAQLVAKGLTNRQVAAAAHISERTVETHVQHVLAKLGFANRSQIAAWAAQRPS